MAKSPARTARTLPDIKPQSPVAELRREAFASSAREFELEAVSPVVGMSASFIRKVLGRDANFSPADVLKLLDQDSFAETIVPRSKVLDYLASGHKPARQPVVASPAKHSRNVTLYHGDALARLRSLPPRSIQCVVTSTPYWGLRLYKDPHDVAWADGETCPLGHEQTPEGFARHTTEILAALFPLLRDDGSIWWNIMDTYNTRTQIRGNAAEALRAMQGRDERSWADHECRRYSAGHAFLKDGELCHIPSMIALRAARIGYYVKSVITWAKTGNLPEPQNSRVSRSLEYVIHLAKHRTPRFKKDVFRTLPVALGGRNNGWESDKLSDVWNLPTSVGKDGHGAQFPLALPARCIALCTEKDDIVLDPFVGAGNSGIAARALGRRFIGIDVSLEYLTIARRRLSEAFPTQAPAESEKTAAQPIQGRLL